MRIRALEADDRDGVLQTVCESFQQDEIAVAVELIDFAIAGSDDYRILVAAEVLDAPSAIGGYVCYGPTPMTASTYDLYWIASHPVARGQGVAGALMQAMEDDLRRRGATGIRVETEETDGYRSAQRLYRRFHYPVVAHLRDFYRDDADLIIYYKRLR